MARALNDPSLVIDPIPLDPTFVDDPEDYAIGLFPEDVEALLRGLQAEEDS
jgi:hypothetical protein